MGAFSIWHWLIVLAVVLVLFGGSGKISSLMGDVAKGIKSFKKGLQDEEEDVARATREIEDKASEAVKSAGEKTEKTKS